MTNDGIFDAGVAATYDARHRGTGSDGFDAMIDVLAGFGGDAPVLEFAIGTGRVALPLAARGVQIKGIELSASMVEVLRSKDQGDQIDIVVGDMISARIEGAFGLVFLVYNTIDNLTTQAAQLACFENAARHLVSGGRFVIETLVPPIQKIPFGQTTLAQNLSDTHWCVDEFDTVSQTYTSHHLHMDDVGAQRLAVPFRYAWPAELDLMAHCAGLSLEHRWADWSQSPFMQTSTSHVSVWKKP